MKLYGIPNCNSVKKALDWLNDHEIAYEFHNYKKSGIDKNTLADWCKRVEWQKLVNRQGTTWRKLDPAVQQTITSKTAGIQLMMEQTSVIKRPVIEVGDQLLVGFDEAVYKAAFL